MRREVGSMVFEGKGSVGMEGVEHKLDIGDIFVNPSWIPWSLQANTQFDLFRFSDAPIMERLNFARQQSNLQNYSIRYPVISR